MARRPPAGAWPLSPPAAQSAPSVARRKGRIRCPLPHCRAGCVRKEQDSIGVRRITNFRVGGLLVAALVHGQPPVAAKGSPTHAAATRKCSGRLRWKERANDISSLQRRNVEWSSRAGVSEWEQAAAAATAAASQPCTVRGRQRGAAAVRTHCASVRRFRGRGGAVHHANAKTEIARARGREAASETACACTGLAGKAVRERCDRLGSEAGCAAADRRSAHMSPDLSATCLPGAPAVLSTGQSHLEQVYRQLHS